VTHSKYNEAKKELEEQFDLLDKIELQIGDALDHGKWTLLTGLENGRNDIYRNIGGLTARIRTYQKENPPYENKIKFDPNW
jgi:hypothetical protein